MSSPYTIPIVDLRAQYLTLRSEVRGAIDEVLESQQFILGPAVARFEDEMARYLRCGFAVGVASGSDALLLALMALNLGPDDGVIVTPFTFFSTVSSITRLGARPLFVDIDPENYLISAAGIETALARHKRVTTLLPVHLFGRCCDMAALLELAERHRLSIIEDVAQACGARMTIEGAMRFAGAVGDLGCFSFFPSKTLGGFGDGGLIAAGKPELAERIRMLRMHGESAKYHHQVTGINSRLDSIQAAVLSVKRRFLDEWCDQRIERAKVYHGLFHDRALIAEHILAVPAVPADRSHVFNNYVIRARKRDELKRFLAEHGVQSEIYYPVPLHLQNCFSSLGYKKGDFPQAERAAAEVLALPIYPELTLEQQEIVVDRIAAFYRR